MTAPDESGINKDCSEKYTDWIATDGKRCTDVILYRILKFLFMLFRVLKLFLEILPMTKVQKNSFPKVRYFYRVLFFTKVFLKYSHFSTDFGTQMYLLLPKM